MYSQIRLHHICCVKLVALAYCGDADLCREANPLVLRLLMNCQLSCTRCVLLIFVDLRLFRQLLVWHTAHMRRDHE